MKAAASSPAFPFGVERKEMNRVSSPDQHARERADTLCREMVELTAHISAAEARFFELLADFDRNEYWRCLGCHSAAQWLTWQCGFGEVAARERVRVARALEKLPEISAAFRRGAISYSKVRELTRAAQPETENALLHVALHGTAAHVQRVVAQHCRAEQLSASAEAISQFRRRYVRYRYDDDGMVLIEARLPVEVGEVVIRAIDAAVEVLYREAASGSPAGADSNQIETKRDVPAGTPTNGSVGGKEADDNVEAAAEFPAETLAAAELGGGPTVRSIEAQADVPAETRSRDRIERARRLDQKASTPGIESPDVSAGTDGGRLSLIGIGPVDQGSPGASGLAQSSDEASDTQTELEPLAARRADGLRLLADSFLSAPTAGRVDTSADRYQVVVHIDQALLCGAVKSCLASGESNSTSCELDDGRALAVETARRLAGDATLVGIVEDENGEPLNVGRRTRAISPALRRALRARDGGCRF